MPAAIARSNVGRPREGALPPRPPAGAACAPIPLLRPIRLLLADSDPALAVDLQTSFDHWAAERDSHLELVGACQDAESLLPRLMRANPDVLLLDLLLPGLEGGAGLDRLQRQVRQGGCRVMVYTSLQSDEWVERCALQVGVAYYLIKPLRPSVLIERIIEVAQNGLGLGDGYCSGAISRQFERPVSQQLLALGIPAHYKGYLYLREAVGAVATEPELLSPVTKRLYPLIARRFDTSVARVERAMRHAIEAAWTHGSLDLLQALFSYHIRQDLGRPSNSLFIARLADKIRLEAGREGNVHGTRVGAARAEDKGTNGSPSARGFGHHRPCGPGRSSG